MATTPKLVLPDIPNLHDIDVYVSNGGYVDMLKKTFSMSPDTVIDEVKTIGTAWARWRGVSDGFEVDVYAEGY